MTEEQPLQHDTEPGRSRQRALVEMDESSRGKGTVDTRERDQPVPQSLRRLSCLSVTNRTHSIDLVGELAPEEPLALAHDIQNTDRVTEAMVLSTCNRIEVYVSTRTPDADDREAALEVATDALALPSDAQVYSGRDVATHLARVTGGIESAVLGEDEIAGQVSDALAAAKGAGLAAGVLNRVGNAALRAGRKCRSETDIDEGPAGYGSAVCRVIVEELNAHPDRVLIVGAGEMAATVARTIQRRWDVCVDVANRSPAHDLTTEDGTWWRLDELAAAVSEADTVVTATDADRQILKETHARQCERTIPVVDLATPPDVSADARAHPAVAATDLSDLAAAVRSATGHRRAAVEEAESVIMDAVDRLVECERENRAEDVIREIHREAANIREAELDRAKRRLVNSEADPEAVLEDFGSALTGRLLGPPTDELRTAARERDETALRTARRLFDLDHEETM
jgi:glutamyl-tRNA reductase